VFGWRLSTFTIFGHYIMNLEELEEWEIEEGAMPPMLKHLMVFGLELFIRRKRSGAYANMRPPLLLSIHGVLEELSP
jgi:hypothetical protein